MNREFRIEECQGVFYVQEKIKEVYRTHILSNKREFFEWKRLNVRGCVNFNGYSRIYNFSMPIISFETKDKAIDFINLISKEVKYYYPPDYI